MDKVELLAIKVPFGRKNAVSRASLSEKTGIPDRKMRDAISKANELGLFVLNLGSGYYQPDDMGDMYSYYRIERARAISGLAKLKRMRLVLKAAGYPV